MKKSLIVILILSAFVVPAVSLAAGLTGPIVPSPAFSNTVLTNGGTNGANYTICDLRTLANNIINFAVAFSVIVATLMIAYGGVLYVTGSAGGEAQIKKAHKVLLNAVVGIMIVLLAWILVNIVVSVLSGNGINFWVNSFQCSATPINPSSTNAATNTISGSGTANSGSLTTFAGTRSQKLANAAANNVEPSSTGYCASYVTQDLVAAGYTQFAANHPRFAYQYGSYLTNAGFATVPQSGYVPQAGDVVVFAPLGTPATDANPACNGSQHSCGHVEVYDGSHWDSDFSQQTMYPYTGGSYTIYRPTS